MKRHISQDERTVFECSVFSVVEELVATDGRLHTYAFVKHRGAVVVLPLLPDGSIILISQWREALKKRIIELPAGLLNEGESPEEAARRELREEVGYYPHTLRKTHLLHTTPGFTDEEITLFIGSDLEESPADCDENEDIESLVWSPDKCLEALRQGNITDAKTVASLYHYFFQSGK